MQQGMLETMGWIGVLFLLLQTGLEMDLVSAWRQRVGAFKIAFYCTLIPIAASFLCAYYLVPDSFLANPRLRIPFALCLAFSHVHLFVGGNGSFASRPAAVEDRPWFFDNVGSSLNDLMCWMIFALILALFTQADTTFASISLTMILTLGFTAVCLTAGRIFASAGHWPDKKIQLSGTGDIADIHLHSRSCRRCDNR